MESDLKPVQGQDWDFWTQGLDRAFFRRVHQHSAILGAIAAGLFFIFEQRGISLGLIAGVVTGLFTLFTVEATVRLLFNGGRHAGLKLAVGAVLKLPFLLSGLIGIAWAGYNGFMNIFAVICGMLLTHGVALVLVLATAIASQDRNKERYR